MAMDLDDGKTGGGRGERRPDVGDLVEVYKFPEKKWVTLRLLPGLFSTAGYWIKSKKKDGKPVKFPKPCLSYDPQAQERDSTVPDPWRDAQTFLRDNMTEKERGDRDAQLIQFTQNWWMEAIVRSAQKSLPDRMPKPTAAERKTGFKEKDSDSLTAKRVIRLGKSLLGKIQELKGLNTVESKSGSVKAFSVNDLKYGRDLRIYLDSSKAPADQYQVQLGEKRTPVTEEEMAMLGWDLATTCASPTEVVDAKEKKKLFDEDKKEFDQWATKMGVKMKKARRDVDEDEDFDGDEDDEDDTDSDDDDTPKQKKPNAKGKGAAKKPVDEDDDDLDEDSEEEDDDFDEDEDEAPKGKKPAPKVKGKKPVDEDDFDDEDEEDEDDLEDEDEAPRGKKPTKKPAVNKKKPIDEDDDFDDELDDDDEDEEEEKPSSKKSASKKPIGNGKKKVVEEDDDDLDDDFDDEDEDEAPRGKKPLPKKPTTTKAKGKKPVVEDDDDDFDD
jgi:hypothetical protein